MKAILMTVVFMLLLSCKKDSDAIEVAPPIPEETAPVVVTKTANTTNSLIAEFNAKKKQAKSQLGSLSAEQANALYESYKKKNDSIMRMLEHTERNIVDHFYDYYSDEQGNVKSPPDSIAKKEALLKSAGIEFWEIGEGMVEIRTVPDFYLAIFKGRVTKDYEEFISLMAKDDKELYSADAGLAITFKDLGKRVLNWEKFIAKNPYSALTPAAIDIYQDYQHSYLIGMDNTPTIEFSTNSVNPENVIEFKEFIAANPSSPTTALVKVVLAATGTKDEMTSAIEKAQGKLIDKLIEDTTPDYR